MQVKCQICGKSIDRSTAYKVVVNGANKYFCSEEEYMMDKVRKERVKEVLETITEVYQYCTDYPEPPYNIIQKELKENLKAVDVETICQFVKENREKLKKTIERKIERDGPFGQSYFAFRYISGVIKREILEKDWGKTHCQKQETAKINLGDIDFYQNKNREQHHTLKRRPLNELEDEADGY